MKRKFAMVKKSGLPLPTKAMDDLYEIVLSVPVAHAFDEVWGALVKPEKLALWLMPVTGKLAKGGDVHLGDVAQAKIAVCEPKRRLSMTFMRAGSQQTLDITFAETGKGKSKTRNLTLTVVARKSDLPPDVWGKFGPAAVGIGWELVCRSLFAYLQSPNSPPKAGAIVAFAASQEGRDYLKEAFDAWCQAAQAGGVDTADMAKTQPSLLGLYSGLHP